LGVGNLNMPSPKFYVLTDRGNEFELITPFFEALLPIFEDGAKEMRIEPDGTGLKVAYNGKTSFVPLPDSGINYALVVLARIQILSYLSIALEDEEQTGVFKVRYNDRIIPINVICMRMRDNARWFLIFKLDAALE
jgi:hypothetical protein